jgi:hypothetical protein
MPADSAARPSQRVGPLPAVALLALLLAPGVGAQEPAAAPRAIQDNSFLIEEAYNQDRGGVQHISSFQRSGEAWTYSFTQEWPVGGIRDQLSYSLALNHQDGLGTGPADVALNYRRQLVGSGETPLAVAPRVSLLLPVGDAAKGRGSGGVGLQLAVPASIVLGARFVSHLNAGVTVTPSAEGLTGDRATTAGVTAGASVIWLAAPRLNFMLESVWARNQTVTGAHQVARADSWFLSPGIRGAFNFPSGLQIVPGLAWPIGIGPSRGSDYLFVYLSFEHPFRR